MNRQAPAVHEILDLPEVENASIDALFQIRPSSIDSWIEAINSRELSTMELGAISHEELRGFADDIKESIVPEGSGTERALIAAGVLYGALIARDSTESRTEDVSQLDTDEAKKTVVDAYNSANPDYLARFFAVRNCEIDHFASDVMSVTLSSVQDHIAAIAPWGDSLQNQVLFYTGTVAGAMAVLPQDKLTAGIPEIVLRDFPDSIGPYGYFPVRAEHEAGDSAIAATTSALENQIGFRNDGDKNITVRNNRLVQFEPNGVVIYGDGPRVPVKNIVKVVYLEEEGNAGRPIRRALGMLTRHPGFVLNTYHPSHPNYESVNAALIEADEEGAIVTADKLHVINDTQRHRRIIRRASLVAASVLGFEQLLLPDLKQTLAGLGAVAAGAKLASRCVRKNTESMLRS